MNRIHHVSLLTLLTLPAIATAQSPCKLKDTDVCAMARRIADEMAPALPMRMNQNMSLQTIFATGNVVTMTAKYEYDRASLEQLQAIAGVSNEQVLQFMRNRPRNGPLCSTNEGRYFIAQGGVIRYLYRFNDGSVHTTVEIATCE